MRVSLLKVGGRAVAEIHVIGAVDSDGGRIVFNRFRDITSLQGGVAFGFELYKIQ